MDDLQTLWRKAQSPKDEAALAVEQISQVIHQKSRNEFEQFQRVLFWEMIINTLFTIGLIYWLATYEGIKYPILIYTLLAIGIAYLAWQYLFYRRMKRHQFQDDVLHYIQKGLTILRRYVLNYKVIMAGSLFAGLLLGYSIAANDNRATDPQSSPFVFIEDPFWNFALVLIILGMFLLAIHLNIKYLYQPKINRMQRLLNELQQSA